MTERRNAQKRTESGGLLYDNMNLFVDLRCHLDAGFKLVEERAMRRRMSCSCNRTTD
jgi:hypothetical protein